MDGECSGRIRHLKNGAKQILGVCLATYQSQQPLLAAGHPLRPQRAVPRISLGVTQSLQNKIKRGHEKALSNQITGGKYASLLLSVQIIRALA